jgi:hypothetical protein
MERLPIEIYSILRDYLVMLDFIYLMNTSKSVEQNKRKYVIFELNGNYSGIFLQNKAFRKKLRSSVHDFKRQIVLNLQDEIDSSEISNSQKSDRGKGLTKEFQKNQVLEYQIGAGCEFSLSAMKRIVLSNWISLDQDFLQVLSEVHLIDCPTITDVSCLQNVHTLSISRCRGVTDVSSLHKVHTLHLSHCEGISSILDLTDNSCLSVVNCPKVMDFRNVRRDAKFSLEHPHFLQITGLPNEIHEMTFTEFPEILFGLKVLTLKFDSVAILKIVDCLELTEFPVAFLKTRMRTVVIEQCESLHDVSALGNVLFVSISSCNRLRSLAGLEEPRDFFEWMSLHCRFLSVEWTEESLCSELHWTS